MSKYKILFKITGSISAYKSAYLISKLVQNDFEVQTVASNSALQFIGKATLEGLTGKKVFTDMYEDGTMMSHINLAKWADIVLICPASANTINKLASGISDNLITSLFLAHDWKKPYLIAPAMNTNMFNHPITKQSLEKLSQIGVKVLPVDSGYLACGDVGEGKLLDPDEIYKNILDALNIYKSKKGKVLITSGATREYIDGVRFISNLSTGRTAASIADKFSIAGFDVTYLAGKNSIIPKHLSEQLNFDDFNSLKENLFSLLEKNHYDIVIHAAAVSDYTIDNIETENSSFQADKNTKLNSNLGNILLKLKPTEKLLNYIKTISANKNVFLIAFKFMESIEEENIFKKFISMTEQANADVVVFNSLTDRTDNDVQKNFIVYYDRGLVKKAFSAEELGALLENICEENRSKNVINA